jgi:hypothetical protein
MDRDELDRALTQLDQAETCVFRLVELEPDLIRQPEILDVLTHLKSAIESLRAAGHKSVSAGTAGRVSAEDRRREV